MVWRRVGGSWGYGDLYSDVVVVMDSSSVCNGCCQGMCRSYVMAYAGARLPVDYFSNGSGSKQCRSLANATHGASAKSIGAGLRCPFDRILAAVVYGAAASVWTYTTQAYDDMVIRECSNLDCISRLSRLKVYFPFCRCSS